MNSVQDFLNKCDKANIRNPDMFVRELRPRLWEWLRGAFVRDTILPTDIDGIVEVNGQFLWIENKHDATLYECDIPDGQQRTINALVKNGAFTILLLGWDDKYEISCYQTISPRKKSAIIPANKQIIREFCYKWSTWADNL